MSQVPLFPADAPQGTLPNDSGMDPSQPGKVYALGPHRLICGDSTDPGTVRDLLQGQTPRVQIFDPPYNLAYGSWAIEESADYLMVFSGMGHQGILFQAEELHRSGWSAAFEVVFHGHAKGHYSKNLPVRIHESARFWRRPGASPSLDTDCLVGSGLKLAKDGRPNSVQGGMSWNSQGAPMAKPPRCFAIAAALCAPGELVYDPCAGSGSSLLGVAAAGRLWAGAEIEPHRCDVIRRRWRSL